MSAARQTNAFYHLALAFCAGAAGVLALQELRRRFLATRGPAPAAAAKLVCLADFEARAALLLAPSAWDYFSSGAGDQHTMRANEDVLTQRVALRPRMLVDVSRASCAHALLGRPCGQPWGIAPTAFHALAHAQAERATARAAARAGVAYCQSGSSSASMEEVTEALGAAPAAPGLRRLWQLYLLKSREANLRLLARAEAAGVEALVLTVDRPVLGLRRANLRSAFSLPGRKGTDQNACAYKDDSISEALTWEDVAWLRSATRLPLVLKGLLTREDGAAAVRAGVAGVWVSNHGGRQLDGALSSAEALVDVLQGVREEEAAQRAPALPAAAQLPRTAVWVDGGVRRGSDVVKYLALGADFVWLGKPVVWGLAVGGEEGLLSLLSVLSEEVRNALQLCGLQSVAQITPACVVWR